MQFNTRSKSVSLSLALALVLSACNATPPPTAVPAEVSTPSTNTTVPPPPTNRPPVTPAVGPSPVLPTPRPTLPPPAIVPTPMPKINLVYTAVADGSLAPRVAFANVTEGERIVPSSSFELVFDRAMDKASVEAAFVTQPKIAGALSWKDARTLAFTPNTPLQRGLTVDLGIAQAAKDATGAQLREPFQVRVVAQGNLEILQTLPARDADDVQPDTLVTVMFNRPVIALGLGASTVNAGQSPLTFDPPLEGKFEWLNTSVLVFKPSKPLPGGTRFTGRVAAGLKDTDGAPLAADYTWQFSSSAPKVLTMSPDAAPESTGNTGAASGGIRLPRPGGVRGPQGLAPVDTAIKLTFNQNIDTASAQSKFTLKDAAGATLPGSFAVLSNTLTFTPSAVLAYSSTFTVEVAQGVLSASGGVGGREAFRSQFSTYPKPAILRTLPADGARNVQVYGNFQIVFNAPIDPKSVMEFVSISPDITRTKPYSYWDAGSNTFNINYRTEPATDYVIEIKPGIRDTLGNRIEQGRTVRFRTGNLPPEMRLLLQGGLTLIPAGEKAVLTAVSNNINRIELELFKFELADTRGEFYVGGDTPAPGRSVRKWEINVGSGDTNKQKRTAITLAEGEGKLVPGLYHLRVSSPDFPADQRRWRIQIATLVVSDLSMVLKVAPDGSKQSEALVWATNLFDGQPLSGQAISLYGTRFGNPPSLEKLGTATTGADGVARFTFAKAGELGNFVAQTEGGKYGLVSEQTGGFAQPQIGRGGEVDTVPAYTNNGVRGFIYPERNLYRAGQKVHVKGFVREDDDARYALITGRDVDVVMGDARGQQTRKIITLDAFGGFAVDFDLAEAAPLGNYQLQVQVRNKEAVANTSFLVAAYRPPEFEVTVSTTVREDVRGNAQEATINAQYLGGGSLPGAAVAWNVVARPSSFAPEQLDAYAFDDNDSPWGWPIWGRFGRPTSAPAQPILNGTGSTDNDGKLTLRVPLSRELSLPDASDPGKSKPFSGTLEYSIEANVSGNDNQTLAGRSSVKVHPASYYVGVSLPNQLGEANKPINVNLVTVDWAGKRLAGKAIEVQLVRREWESSYDEASNRWNSVVKDEVLETKTANSDTRGEASVVFTAGKAGSYRVVAKINDEQGRPQTASRTAWVSGSDYVPWYRAEPNSINLISDKSTYDAGETAKILIPSPYAGEHYALITLERGRIIEHRVIKMNSNSQSIDVPLTTALVPNVFVSVVLMKALPALPRKPDAGGTVAGSINLNVRPAAQTLSVTLNAASLPARPSETQAYTITVRDAAGAPVQGSFALDLVDRGILNLRPRQANAIVDVFWGERPLQVRTSSIANALYRVDENAGEGRGGGGGLEAAGAPAGALSDAVILRSTAAPAPAKAAANAPEAPSVRENFADTGYWNAAISTDANGQAVVNIKLPDNLTTWVLRAVGLDAQTRVGEGLLNVPAIKAVQLRPVTPRFVVVGDVIELSAIVQNNTAAPIAASVSLRESNGLSLTTPMTLAVDVPANGERVVRWTATALDAPQVDLIMEVRSDAGSDASRPRLSTAPNGGLRVNRYATEETVGTAGVLEKAGSRTELVLLPPNLTARNAGEAGTLTVRTDSSLVGVVQPGLKFLEAYPYESAEAVTSRFLPNILTLALLREFGQRDAATEAKLTADGIEQIARLIRIQNSDGGWGWYRERDSNPHTSIYVLFGLLRAKRAGLEVQQTVIDRAVRYVQASVRNTDTLRENYERNQQAYALYVLAEAGKPDAKRVDELFALRDTLGVHGKALLGLAIGAQKKDDVRIKTVMADLNGRVVQSATGAHWEEGNPDYWAMNSDTRSTALVLMLNALYDSANPIASNALRWLITERTAEGGWASTYESSWVMIALTEWARATGDLKANYEFGSTLNGVELNKSKASPEVNRAGVISVRPLAGLKTNEANTLVIARGEGDGRLYYTAHLRAFLPVPSVKAKDAGIIISRRFVNADCKNGASCESISTGKIGDVVRVELSVIAPSNLSYVQVEDFLPAGAELVDSNLATTSQLASAPSLSGNDRPGLGRFSWFPWWNWYTRAELKDDRVGLFSRQLSKGSYTYSYTMRLTNAGVFNVIPAHAQQQYFPEVFGRSDGSAFTVTR